MLYHTLERDKDGGNSQNSVMWDTVEEIEVFSVWMLRGYDSCLQKKKKKLSRASSVKEEIRFIQYDPSE